MLKRPVILLAGLLFAAMLVFGLARLFELRLARGDIYPPYSSLRTDPLGASVFYESLPQIPGVGAERYFEAAFRNDAGRGQTLFVLGAEPDSRQQISRSEFNVLQRFVFSGGRIVIAYYPEISETWSSRRKRFRATNSPAAKPPPDRPGKSDDTRPGGTNFFTRTNQVAFTNGFVPGTNTSSAQQTNPPDSDQDDDWRQTKIHSVDLETEWGFDFIFKNLVANDEGKVEFPAATLAVSDAKLPATLNIHTALGFTHLTNGWTAVYERDEKTPVVVERHLGSGSIVLLADSYPFSNEAMFKDRHAALLAWALGGGRNAIFDEAHLGVVEQPGVALLMRRYRLHGLIFSLLAVAGLFIWKNSSSLVPPADAEAEAGPVILGRDSSAGFVNLLRRGVPPTELINVGFAEWKKSSARRAAVSPGQLHAVEQAVEQQNAQEPRRRNPVETYRLITQILKRQK